MTDAAALVANPDAIRDFGTAVGRQSDSLHGIGRALADGEVNPHAFGKLPEAKEFHRAYAQHAVEVRTIIGQLPAHVNHVREGLHAAAGWYDSVHQGLSAGELQVAEEAAGACEEAYSWTDEAEQPLPRLGDEPEKSHGLAGLIDEAIEWTIEHVPELTNLLDAVTGDFEELRAAAELWHEQGESLNQVIHELRKEAAGLHEEWHGDGAANFGEYMANVIRGLTELADVMGQTQVILDDAAREASSCHHLVVTITREVVEWVAGNIIVDVLVAGTATALQAAGTAAFLAEKVAAAHAAASSLATFYSSLLTVVRTLQEAKAGMMAAHGIGQFAKFLTLGWDFNHALELGRITQVGAVLHPGQDVEWLAGRAVRLGVGTVALKGIGGIGLAKTLSEEVGKDALGQSVKDLLKGKAEKAGHDFKQRVGLETPDLPDAAPASEIESLLEGEPVPDKPGPEPETADPDSDSGTGKPDDDKPYTGALY